MNNTTREFYHLFLKIMPKWIKWVKALLMFSFPLFVKMLNNSYFLDVLKSECSSTRGCSWLLIVCLFLWNLKMVCKSLYKYKSVDLKFLLARNWALLWEMFVHSLWLHVQGWSKQTVKVIFFHCHLFFYRLWHVISFIHPSLDIIYGFWTVASENKLSYTHIQLYFTPFSKSRVISTIYH